MSQSKKAAPEIRYAAGALLEFTRGALTQAGLTTAMARDVAEILLEGDLLGKTTHGLQLLAPYLESMAKGEMTLTGTPAVVHESPATLALDANYLPGPFVIRHAIARALPKARALGSATVSIRRCHHIGCLQAYLKPVTDHGLVMLLLCSDPANTSVAPDPGAKGVCCPNPLALGYPTAGAPVLIDLTTGSVTNGQINRLHREGKKLPHRGLQTARGQPTNDPAALFAKPPGSILPLGSPALSHKGFALSLLVETLTSALAGHGRADGTKRWGASVFLQIHDPQFFGGYPAFQRETHWFAQACRDSSANAKAKPVRLPGEHALAARREQLACGVALHPSIPPVLKKIARKFAMEFPRPLESRK